MKTKIKEAIKAKHKNLTLSGVRMDALTDKLSKVITDEADIQATIDSYDFEPYFEMARLDDTIVGLKNKPQEPANPTPEPQPTDIASIVANAVSQAVTPLQERLNAIDSEKGLSSKRTKLSETLKDAPDFLKTAYLGQINDQMTDEAFNAVLEQANKGFEEFKESQPKQGGIFSAQPSNGDVVKAKADAPELKQFANIKN